MLALSTGLPLPAVAESQDFFSGGSQPPAAEGLADAEAPLAVLRDTGADRAARDAAAEALVRLAHRPQISQALVAILQDDELQEMRGPLLRAIARTWNPSPRLFAPLVELARRQDSQRITSIIPAISAYGSRDAAAVLVAFLGPESSPAVRDAAAAALARMTGRDDMKSDAAAWNQWLEVSRGFSDVEWRDMLAEGVWRRAERLENDRRALGERLAEGFRRLYLATPAEDRPRLLAQMMLDARPELRDAGLEIISRELAAGKAMDGPIIDAAVRLLRSSDARVRTRAAALLAQLGAGIPAGAIAEALQTELDPEAAASLLQAAARGPDAAACDAVLRWMTLPITRNAAFDAALALHRSGVLIEDFHREQVLAALRATDALHLGVSGVQLLALLGNEGDREHLTILLAAPSGSVRLATAAALAEFPHHVETILEAALQDQALFASAVRAVTLWRASVDGLLAINELPAVSAQEHRAGLLRVAAALPIVDLLAVAASTQTDLTLREALLARVVERPMGPFLPGDEEDLATLAESILLLAETRLALKRPDRALAAIEALPTGWNGTHSPRTSRLRVIALLWTNRIAAAGDVDAPVSAWLDALELAIGDAHAPAIAQEIRARWSDSMHTEDRQRFETLQSLLPSAPVDSSSDPESPPQSDPR